MKAMVEAKRRKRAEKFAEQLALLPQPEQKKKPKHSVCEYLVGDIACKSGKCNVLLFVVDLDCEELVDVMPTALCRMVVKHNANKQDKLELAMQSGCDVTTHNHQPAQSEIQNKE